MANRLYLLVLSATLLSLPSCANHSGHKVSVTAEQHTERVMSVSWRHDGKYLASAGFDGTVRLWEVPALHQERVFNLSSPYVLSVTWSPNGTRLIAVTNDTVELLDPETGEKIRIIRTKAIPRAVWNSSGRFVALPGWSRGDVRVVDGVTGEMVSILQGHTKLSSAAGWSPDGALLATTGWDNTIRIWDTGNWKEKIIFRGVPTGPVGLAWSPNGGTLASYVPISKDVRLYDPLSGSERILRTDAGVVTLAWQPNGATLAVGLVDGTIQMWDPAKGDVVGSQRCGRFVDEVKWDSTGRFLAAVPLMERALCLWDAVTGSQRSLTGHRRPVISLEWSPHRAWLASGGYDGVVLLWKLDQ